MNKEQFYDIVKKNSPNKHKLKNALMAFIFGGTIGFIAEGFFLICRDLLNFEKEDAMLISTMGIVLIAAILTGFSLFTKVAKIAGAGLFVPTTGFANSVIASTIDAKFEGPIHGIGSRIFFLAGSVITYGVFFSFLYTVIRLLLSLMGVSMS